METNLSDDLVKKVRHVINDKELTGYKLAKEYGLSEGNISSLRSGKRSIYKLNLSSICKVLNAYENSSK